MSGYNEGGWLPSAIAIFECGADQGELVLTEDQEESIRERYNQRPRPTKHP